MRRPLGNRLSVRLGIALGLATAVILMAAGAWNLRLQRGQLTRLIVAAAAERAEDIRRSTREAMMQNRPEELRRIIETIASPPTVERIRLFDKRGQIRISSDPREDGTLVDIVAEQCVLCHRAGETLGMVERDARTRILERDDGSRVLGVIAPIHNEPGCAEAACHAHPESQTVLGVLDIQLSLRDVDQNLAASQRQMLGGLFGTALAVVTLAWFLVWRLILRPVNRLTAAASNVAAGHLSTHIPVGTSDEIGEMTEAWNTMIARLGQAQLILERWSRTLEQRVREKTAELEQAHRQMLRVERMASLGKVSAVMAHEINNPLTGIATYARLLRKRLTAATASSPESRTPTDVETERILRLIEEESARCSQIVGDLLQFSREPVARFTRTPLGPILDRCGMLLRHQAERRRVELQLAASPDLPPVQCDAAQIQQLILVLGANAVEATPAGGRVTVAAQAAAAGDRILLQIRDTGKGIPTDQLQKIFEPFFTTKEEGTGLGLGLAIAQGIATRHQATIEVESSPGCGSVFTVRLPIDQSASAEPATNEPATDEPVTQACNRGATEEVSR